MFLSEYDLLDTPASAVANLFGSSPQGPSNYVAYANDDDDDESTRSRRFSPIQWLMHACCQIATTDDTDELFNTQSRLSNQVESMRMDIHMDHQAVAASVASIDDITKQFNVIADTTKHALASSLLNEEKLEQRESPLLKPIINLYTSLETMTKGTKLSIAAGVCQSKRIPIPSNHHTNNIKN
ncbi:hypothetical protein M8J76_011099 [Diaphorina citri]|nr:hypothetical protein M8J76_011099 [Diaphorina citri]